MESVSLYQPGESWALQAKLALRSEEITASGVIIGKVTTSDRVTGLTDIRVTADRLVEGVTWEVTDSAFINITGEYSISSLATGIYCAKLGDPARDNLVSLSIRIF